MRDRNQRDQLVQVQMVERRGLQHQIDALNRKHAKERTILARDVASSIRTNEQVEQVKDMEREQTKTPYRGLTL